MSLLIILIKYEVCTDHALPLKYRSAKGQHSENKGAWSEGFIFMSDLSHRDGLNTLWFILGCAGAKWVEFVTLENNETAKKLRKESMTL